MKTINFKATFTQIANAYNKGYDFREYLKKYDKSVSQCGIIKSTSNDGQIRLLDVEKFDFLTPQNNIDTNKIKLILKDLDKKIKTKNINDGDNYNTIFDLLINPETINNSTQFSNKILKNAYFNPNIKIDFDKIRYAINDCKNVQELNDVLFDTTLYLFYGGFVSLPSILYRDMYKGIANATTYAENPNNIDIAYAGNCFSFLSNKTAENIENMRNKFILANDKDAPLGSNIANFRDYLNIKAPIELTNYKPFLEDLSGKSKESFYNGIDNIINSFYYSEDNICNEVVK